MQGFGNSAVYINRGPNRTMNMEKRNNCMKWLCLSLLVGIGIAFTGCSSDDEAITSDEAVTRLPNGEIYGKWKLDGYVDSGTFVCPESSGTDDCYLSLEEDGSFNAKICNWFQGEYTFNKDGDFRIIDGLGTLIWSPDSDQNISSGSDLMFMEDQIINIRSYRLEKGELRLYYSDNDYLRFSR